MKLRLWWRVALVACLGIGMAAPPLVAPATAAAATIRYGADNRQIPLLLIHGYTDTCKGAWNVVGADHTGANLPQPNSDAWNYLHNSGFSNIQEIGYYNVESSCQENLVADSGLTQCPSFGSASFGTSDDRLDRLSCLFAWYIYVNYTQYGEPVNVLAHSMGGLLTRYALGAVAAHAAYFPPVLWVNNAVTVATPHGGIGGPYHDAAANNGVGGVQFEMMNQFNGAYNFMSTIAGYDRPQGWGGTRWTLIGASDASNAVGDAGPAVSFWASQDGDGVVPTASQLAMTADYKVEYGARTPSLVPGNVADSATQYEHETGIIPSCYAWLLACFNGPYYLNDSSGNGTQAWICTMCSGIPGGSPVAAARSLLMIATELQQKAVPNLPSYSFVFRSNANGYYVSAELGYAVPDYAMLRARAATQGAWESWTKVQLPTGHWVIRNNANGNYVSAELGYPGADYAELRARTPATGVGLGEVFDIVGNADGTYSLRSLANGLYVSAELGYAGAKYGELRARSSAIGAWEEFNLSTTGSGGCVNYGGGNITGPDSCAGTFSTHSIWYSGSPLGLLGRERWTWANGSVQDSTATWQLSGLSVYYIVQIYAFIPRYHSNAQHVHYTLCAPGNGCGAAYVNQSPYYDQWTVVGDICTSDGTATITLADDGGDLYPRQIAADAVQGVRTSAKCSI